MPESAFITRPRLVLASSSPRRRDLLNAVGVEVVVQPADVDETSKPGETAEQLVRRLARMKADAVEVAANDMVIGADTVVTIDGEILGKPVDDADARRMLALLSGRDHDVMTGVAVRGGDRTEVDVGTTRVTMRPLSSADIGWYVDSGEPMGKAGAYAVQGAGSVFVTGIVGNHTGVVGLPIPLVDALLSRFGRPLPTWRPRTRPAGRSER